ncbi:MAG: polymerase LigD, ligase domain protein, partial [Verrucomicrobiales bacterium]|nr:polymerase LigD, ligase domain protein [Verrucomicrobiales bacterium]
LKFDGFRALALKSGDKVTLLSRANKDLTARFPEIAEAISALPAQSLMLDGEIVALDPEGRSSFQLLQNSQQNALPQGAICFYVFDLLQLEKESLISQTFVERRKLLETIVKPHSQGILRYSDSIKGDPTELLKEIKRRGMEGIIAKRLDSQYEAGQRSGSWAKIKVNLQQEFVIGGYTAPQGSRSYFGALLVGFYQSGKLRFASKVGTGFDQKILRELYHRFNRLKHPECPFVNLPESRSGRFGQGITRAEMKKCSWVEPSLVAQVSFTEWTNDNHLRHPVFLGLREDKAASEVVREKPETV